jgi:uncharacterized protein YcfJ
MHLLLRHLFVVAGVLVATQAMAQITFYEQDNFRGQSVSTQKPISDFTRARLNDRSSSVEVMSGRWEVCEDRRFNGRCVVLRQGSYPSLAAMGLNNQVSSVRPVSQNARVNEHRYAPPPAANPADFRRRQNERLYEARVTSARAVVGPPEQRCWVEREQLPPEQRSANNLPAAVAGALLGGVLGHQVGGGSGKDLATIGGAVAGAAIGNQVGRNNQAQPPQTRDVQRCQEVPSQAPPEFWDVTYNFRGLEHHVQLKAPPGPSITVNRRGEPREQS